MEKIVKKSHINELNQHKAEELFSLSHRLLDIAKEFSEYHLAELRMGIAHTKEISKAVAQNDLKQLEQLQKRAAIQGAQRMRIYQRNAKALLRKVGNESSDKAEKYLEKAHDALSDWLEESERKLPVGGEKLSKVAREISSAGAKAFKEGRKLLNNVVDNLDELIESTAGQDAPVKKPAPKKLTTQKADVGNVVNGPNTVPKE
jgi:SpoVK/Ycf46/Vps4 family AAA+-type ATPase